MPQFPWGETEEEERERRKRLEPGVNAYLDQLKANQPKLCARLREEHEKEEWENWQLRKRGIPSR